MGAGDPHVLRSAEALREIVGEPMPGLELKNQDRLDEFAIDFISKSPFVVLATSDAAGRLDASPKGDAAGFVWVEDERTVVIPDRPGNKLAYGHQNIIENPCVGLLFLIPGTPETVRVNGRAELSVDPALLERLAARGRPAVLAIRVRVEECFFHCSKAFVRASLWKPDTWPPRQKVSWGEMFAKRAGADAAAAKAIDEAVEADLRENL